MGYVPNGNRVNNATPAIHLKGQWLRQAGFNTCLLIRSPNQPI
nr:SymE family type I addiction module toxin [Photorhabdus bodei]